MLPGFADNNWLSATNGVGYETGLVDPLEQSYATLVLQSSPLTYWRLNETNGTSAVNLGSMGGAANGTYHGGVTLGTSGPRPPQVLGFEPDNYAPLFNGGDSYVGGPASLLDNVTQFTMAGWIRPTGSQGSRTGLFGQNDTIEFGFIDSTTIQLWTFYGAINQTYPFPNNQWHHVAATGDGINLALYFDGNLAATAPSPTPNYGSSGFNFNIGGGGVFDPTGNPFLGQIDEVAVWYRALSAKEVSNLLSDSSAGQIDFSPFIDTDLRSQMYGVAASAYLRLPFAVNDPSAIDQLILRVKYDDGFVAYLNGQEISRRNVPDTPDWNSTATARHPDGLAAKFEEIDISPLRSFLTLGTNVLAIQGLNIDATNVDFLIQAELIATSTAADDTHQLRYFMQPTPGGPNGIGAADLGPVISQTGFAPGVPGTNDSLTVTCYVAQAFATVTNVTLNWRVMFGPVNQTLMFDDGLHGDGAANDGIFGAIITNKVGNQYTYQAGQMVRWYITSSDGLSRTSRWPLFETTNNSAAYLGTVIQPDSVTSKLPIMHLFVDPAAQSGVDVQSGGPLAVYYDGEFYDNVRMHVRGNTTAGYVKKSHSLAFHADHPFRHPGPGPRIRKFSLMADYPDPAYMRQGLSFWLCNLAGAPAPFYVPVRLQLNGNFYQLANETDYHGEELLSRLGYDPNGALYKATGTVQPSVFSTGVFEKRTRTWEGTEDYVALANGISETLSTGARRTNACDLLDLPEVINYLAVARLVHENDDVWANMSLYHDNDGDGLWRIVPFDMNLSWGAMFGEGDFSMYDGIQVTNDMQKSFPLYGSSKALALTSGAWNRMYDVIFTTPELRQMFLRRTRTLLDAWVKPPGTLANLLPIEPQVIAWRDLISEEAQRDRTKWGWPPEGGQSNFHPGIDLTNGVADLINLFIAKRRQHYYGKHSVTNTALPTGISKTQNAGIPLAQPDNVSIVFGAIEFNPASGNQDEEYVQLRNTNSFAVDVSGWQLGGGINFSLKRGTVIPTGGSLYLSPSVKAFRARAASPHGGQGLYVQGNYSGRLSARGESLILTDAAGRLVATNSYIGNPSLAQRYLRITELMYNPAPLAGNTNDAQEFEYVELKNISTNVTLDLHGVRFSKGIDFSFTASAVTNLGAGHTVLVVRNVSAFAARYGGGFNIAGEYLGYLDNAGETVRLEDAVGESILEFPYNNQWYPITDGLGFSLVIVNENAPWDTWGDRESWRPSGALNGSPGQADPAPPVFAPVIVNEALANSAPPEVDTVELFNPSPAAVSVAGWLLTDDFLRPQKYRFPEGTMVPPNGFLVVDATQFDNATQGTNAFRLSSLGDAIYLFSADAATNLTGYYHGFHFGPSPNGVAFGRYVNSVGQEDFVLESANTFGAGNAPPRVGPVVISEIMYHPPSVLGTNTPLDEFVELQNITTTNVPLYDPAHSTNTWHLANAVDYIFPTNVILSANSRLLVVGFDPGDAPHLAAFRQTYNVPSGVAVFGPWAGRLNNAGEPLELKQPDKPEVGPTNTVVPYYLVEKVHYLNQAPWPPEADGAGSSLQRRSLGAYANDPTNWFAAGVSAGLANQATLPLMPDSDGDGMPDAWELANGTDPLSNDANADPDHDGFTNLQEYWAGTSPTNAASALRIESAFTLPTGSQVLSFTAMSNHTYTVLFRNDLPSPWQKLTDIPSQPATRQAWITNNPGANSTFFYRLITPKQD
jgi:hypothetical protein